MTIALQHVNKRPSSKKAMMWILMDPLCKTLKRSPKLARRYTRTLSKHMMRGNSRIPPMKRDPRASNVSLHQSFQTTIGYFLATLSRVFTNNHDGGFSRLQNANTIVPYRSSSSTSCAQQQLTSTANASNTSSTSGVHPSPPRYEHYPNNGLDKRHSTCDNQNHLTATRT